MKIILGLIQPRARKVWFDGQNITGLPTPQIIGRGIGSEGVSVFMVEPNASLALQIAQYGYVLRTGAIALSGPASDLARDPRIRDAYLGGEKSSDAA